MLLVFTKLLRWCNDPRGRKRSDPENEVVNKVSVMYWMEEAAVLLGMSPERRT